MDPVTHTLTGAALARGGLYRASPLATAALVIGANAPDIDILAYTRGEYAALAFRRGWTHGPLALLVLPVLVTGILLLWDRSVRRRARPEAPPARAAPLLILSALAVLTHPLLDWLNTYGVRFFMPFDGRWFYGDALFIIDPWVWLALGAAVCLAGSRHRTHAIAWATLAAAATTLLLIAPIVPTGVRVAWLAGLVLTTLLWRRRRAASEERLVRIAGATTLAYITVMIATSRLAESRTATAAAAAGIDGVREVMFQPAPGQPFAGTAVVVTDEAYHSATVRWLRRPTARVSTRGTPRGVPRDAVESLDDPRVRDYLTWSRYPYFRVDIRGSRASAFFGDARYPRGSGVGALEGVRVPLGPGGLQSKPWPGASP